MEILVIDRDTLTNQLISTRLAALGHRVTVEANKNTAFDLIKEKTAAGQLDCVLIDPSPLAEARPVVIGIWKNIRSAVKPYIMLLSKTSTTADAILAGTNDVLAKPFASADLETKTGNAERLMGLSRWLAREDNVHSGGGMIGKSAFYQLYLSAIDRSFRYAEESLIVFITLTNEDEIVKSVGQPGYEEMVAELTRQMTFMRRQSDVIARLGTHDFAILLQRPQYDTEAMDALNRFAETLAKLHRGFADAGKMAPCLNLRLVGLPQGGLEGERHVPHT